MRYILRWIEGAELDRLSAVIDERGWTPLNPFVSRALIAEDNDGEILGFLVLRLVPHTEPVWIRDGVRGTGIAEELADRMVEYLLDMKAAGWFVVADSPFAEKLCRERGMKKVTSPVYMFTGESAGAAEA